MIIISTFKTDVTIVGLVFSISNLVTNKISQGRTPVREKKTY